MTRLIKIVKGRKRPAPTSEATTAAGASSVAQEQTRGCSFWNTIFSVLGTTKGKVFLLICLVVIVTIIPGHLLLAGSAASNIDMDPNTRGSSSSSSYWEKSSTTSSNVNAQTYYNVCSKIGSKSLQQFWNDSIPEILNATHVGHPQLDSWMTKLMDWHTYHRLRQSVSLPLEPFQRILEIAAAQQHQQGGEQMTISRPIRILVLGDSVAKDHACNGNHLNVNTGDTDKECAWSHRLERMLNVFFPVQVTNMASGGIDSEVGAMALEYRLFPEGMGLPDIVLAAYSPNDAPREKPFETGQDLITNARKLRCDKDLPLVMLVADFWANNDQRTDIDQVGRMYALADWNRVGMCNYGAVLRHSAIGFDYGDSKVKHPVTSSIFETHLGMGYHIGQAWAVLFNFMAAMVDACNHDADETQQKESVFGLVDLPIQSVPRLRDGTLQTTYAHEWKTNAEEELQRCEKLESEQVCSFSWMLNTAAGISNPQDIDRVLKPYLTHVVGWKAEGDPFRNPQTGWYANSPRATFTLEFKNVAAPIKYLTIISMKSYGPKFVGSNVRVVVDIVRSKKDGEPDKSPVQQINEISGYHEAEMSVHFTNKFPLPDNGARVGDSIRVQVDLMGGSHFKIAGMAFCEI